MAGQSFEEKALNIFRELCLQVTDGTRTYDELMNSSDMDGDHFQPEVAISAAHQAAKQAYAVEVLKDVRYKLADQTNKQGGFREGSFTLETIDQAIQKINQDLGREV